MYGLGTTGAAEQRTKVAVAGTPVNTEWQRCRLRYHLASTPHFEEVLYESIFNIRAIETLLITTGPSYPSAFPIPDDYRKPRTLVFCFDGTINEFSKGNTNVVKLYSILKKDDPKPQLLYYQERRHRDVLSAWRRFAAWTLDEIFAWYISEHIMNGYKFLMQN
ncbi:hypothetical protein EI94DRAFT_1805354 [Lactarius quietus]|nr:hypothetical protein EI94DRAFT_1805354 [Lactarius quietus]